MFHFWIQAGLCQPHQHRYTRRRFMNSTDVISFIAGLLQFVVAGYTLRLNRRFGAARVGWSLFWAFFLMALLHLTQSIIPGGTGLETGAKMDVMYAFISMLLLISMVHLETVLKERERVEREEKRMRAELQSEVKRQTAYLMRAIEELQSEVDGRKHAEAEVETTHLELRAVSRKAGSAQITASVLRSVTYILKSVNVSANLVSDRVKQSKIANIVHIGALIREHAADLGKFMTHDPRGQKLPVYIAQLAEYLAEEQTTLSTELESIRKNIEHTKDILTMHQKCTHLASLNDDGKVVNVAEKTRGMSAVAVA
jgi:hypothetical protein